MTVTRKPFRRALATALISTLAISGALVATSSASAVPGPPLINSPLDDTAGVFSTTVEPDINGLEQTIQVFTRSETGVEILHCTVVTTTDPEPCIVTIPSGQYGFYQLFGIATDVNGASNPSDPQSLRYGAPAVSGSLVLGAPLNLPDVPIRIESLTPVISGTGPALATVELRGYRSDLGPAPEADPLCSASILASGVFSCSAVFDSYGTWEVQVITQDVDGGFVVVPESGTLSLAISPPPPTVEVSVALAPAPSPVPAPPSVDLSVSGVPGSQVGSRLSINPFTDDLSPQFCPDSWAGNPDSLPTGGAVVTCEFTDVPVGVHSLQTDQFINGVASITRKDLIYIAAPPTLTVTPFPGGATFSGTVDTLANELAASGTVVSGLFAVVRDGVNEVCSGPVDLTTGAWSCDGPLEPGGYSFAAYAFAEAFSDNPALAGEITGDYSAGSTLSGTVDATIGSGVVPPSPSMGYDFGPATVGITAQGLQNSAVGIELYSVTEPDGPGGGYQYDQPVDSCGFIPGEGDDGLIVTSPSVITDCLFDGLAPGIWNVYSSQRYYFEQSNYVDDYIRIPSAPTLTASRNDAEQIIASGQGTPGFRVLVRQLGGSGVCDAVVGTSGAWSCVVPGIAGDALLRAQQQSQGFVADPNGESLFSSFDGYSAFTPTAFVAAVPPTPRVNPTPPVVAPQPLPWTLEGYNGEPLFPGQTLSLSAQGLPVGTEVIIEIRSTPKVLGSSLADDLGRFALDVTVPRDLEPGDHTLVGLATPPGGVVSPIEIPVVVVAAPVDDAGSEQPAPVSEGSEGSEGSSGGSGDRDVAIDRSDPAAPSAISDSIPTIDRIFRTPLIAVTASGLALAILLLVALPAELLNSTVASNSRRLGRWYAAIDDRIQRATEWFAAITRTRALAAALLVVATSVIFGFVDPDYGFDPVSLRMTVSLAIGLFVVTYVSAWISGAIIQRVWNIPTRVGLQPAALLFAVVGVILARLLEFSPGFLIGLVIGLDLLTRVDAKFRVRATLTSLGVTVGLALLGWIGYSILSAVSAGEPTVAELLLSDALVATAAEGMTAALASLLPLGFLQGHEIFRRSKGLWAGTFLVVAMLFALIVLPTASGTESEVADVGFWMLVMVIFAVVALTLWAVLQFTGRGDDDAEEAVDQPVGAER